MKYLRNAQLFYLIGTLLLLIKTFLFCLAYVDLPLYRWRDYMVLVISCISSVGIISVLTAAIGKKMRAGAFLLVYLVLSGILYGNLLYYRFYIDFVTLPILYQFDNVGGLSQSTLELLDPLDIILFLDILLLVIWWIFSRPAPVAIKRRQRGLAAVTFFVLAFAFAGGIYWSSEDALGGGNDRAALVKSLGPFYYHGYDIFATIRAELSSSFASAEDYEKAMNYLHEENELEVADEALFGSAEGRNLIFINLESTQDFVINKEVNGEEITPFLNDLVEDSLYFDHIYHQTAQGKTSDAEFMIDQSFYPMASGSVYVRKPDNEYQALPEILESEGYYAAALHGNESSFWNRNEAYDAFGYDHYYAKTAYEVTEENTINYGIKDKAFFSQSMPYLTDFPKPFYAKFLTLTNHFPFLLEEEDINLALAGTGVDVVDRYFTTVRYQDEALASFFDELKEAGLYEDSIFLIMGDHYGISENYYDGIAQYLGKSLSAPEEQALQQVPVIIHIPGTEGKTYDTVGGQIDIMPTLLYLLGMKDDSYPHFGTNLLAANRDKPVIFRDGSFVTDEYVYTEQLCYERSSGEQTDLDQCAQFFSVRNKELFYSDTILNGDLLRFAD